jgi:S-adenosylmethionine:tRNA ribosyltransferase-isomerase
VLVDLFDYDLPADRISQAPRPRGTSGLLTLDRASGAVADLRFSEFPELLRPRDLLVRNDVRVRNTRLYGRDEKDRLVEIFLLSPVDPDRRTWQALAKPGRRARSGRTIRFEPGDVLATVRDVDDEARRVVVFDRPVDEDLLARIGHVPLPPYVRREAGVPDRPEDREGYQTVYAREPLAVAAPTAGLHFTAETFDQLKTQGVEVVDLTLAVGAGTFKPVRALETTRHRLDAEEVFLPAATMRRLRAQLDSGRRVVAVGTTVTRALEGWIRLPASGVDGDLRFSTDLFITPGFEFRVVGALLTNFHLPRSTLLMLVSAFAGRESVLAAYAEAIRRGYLFYSFGDAMWIA